ncbi:MFS transporter [Coralliovum pocilloporae]|uniref:MFS transporter n=1 Tax=Coralliovum pocilloporae TaxID=3066369 RepID=UPI003306A539
MLFLRVLIPFALGYFLSYLFRVVNSVAGPHLAESMQLDSGDLGLLTSTYFLTFAAAQIPLGLLLDKFGPRKVEAVLLLFAAAGSAIFAASTGLVGLTIGRALIGFGVSAALMAAFKAYAEWSSAERLPLINGIHLTAGGLGALVGGRPTDFLINAFDWRAVFFALAVATAIVALAIYLIVPRKDGDRPSPQSFGQQMQGLKTVVTHPAFWAITPLCVLSQATYLAIPTLWAGPWLRDLAGFTPASAANLLSFMAAAQMAGFLGLGALATRLGNRGISAATVSVCGMGAFLVAQVLLILLPAETVWPVWLLYTFAGTSGIISYAALTQLFPRALAGRVNTAINFLVFILAFAMQWLTGELIDLFESGVSTGYTVTFTAFLALQSVAWVWYFARRHELKPVEQTA